jgi:hypothetical protein
VRAGETNQLEYASVGRAVVGQATTDPRGLAVDWLMDDHVLSLKVPAASSKPRPNREDYATYEALRKANEAFLRSDNKLEQARAARTDPLVFESDGSFQAEDVPPGTYELRVRVTKPGEAQRNPFPRSEDDLGSLVREVVIPEGNDAIDLGILVVPMKGGGLVRQTAPLDLVLKAFDDRPVPLANYRGKPLLLVLWAAWSERSLEGLAALRQWKMESGFPPGLAILGLNLDDDLDAAKRAVREGAFDWPQTRLDAESRAKMTAALDVNTLPMIFLLDAEGRIVQRDLGGERLRAAVKRTLRQQ